MKKTPAVNFIIIIGLLVLCVTTLIVIYATGPDSSILLLEENFESLDENKWSHEVLDCTEDGEQFHYVTATEENGLIANGILHIYPNMTEVHFRTKRNSKKMCDSCTNSKNSTCLSSHLSARMRSKQGFEAKHGRIEILAKLCWEGDVRFNIAITRNQNDSNLEEALEGFLELDDGIKNSSAEFRIFYESGNNQTILRSEISDCEFHIYDIIWNEEKISLSIDNVNVGEKKLVKGDSEEENISNKTVKPDSAPISKPFYLKISVEFQDPEVENSNNHTQNKRSLNILEDLKNRDLKIFEVDYIRIFKILN